MRDPSNPGLTREEGLALIVAVAAHIALIAALTLAPPGKDVQPPPQRMTVTFSDQIADQSTSPDPAAQAAPDVAPQLGEAQSVPDVQPQPAPPAPQPVQPPPQPQPKPQTRPQPQAKVQPVPQPVPRPAPRPVAPAPAKPVAQPAKPAPAKPAPAKPAPAKPSAAPARAAPAQAPARPKAPAGGSRVGDDFLRGVPGATAPGTSRTPPAATIGPEVRSTLVGAISRQIKPHWVAPQGVDAEKLVTVLAWTLNPDGSLAGRPTVVEQLGITDANRAQAPRHAEQAIRAVQLAAPFSLPPQYYNGWKRVAAFRFDRKLSQ